MKSHQTRRVFHRAQSETLRARYLLFLPPDFGKPRERPPLILFLHGAGERGSDLSKVALHGPPKIVEERPDFPFIVVSPQCGRGKLWSKKILLALLDEVVETHNADPARIYLTGMSMGGYGAWDLALSHPERFTAVAPICGGGDVLKVLLAEPRKLGSIKSLGIWAFHGGKDPVVPVHETERMIAALREVGSDARLTIYPEAEHDAWTQTYNNPDLYKWFLGQQRRQIRRRAARKS